MIFFAYGLTIFNVFQRNTNGHNVFHFFNSCIVFNINVVIEPWCQKALLLTEIKCMRSIYNYQFEYELTQSGFLFL